jgi:hypothetical protein
MLVGVALALLNRFFTFIMFPPLMIATAELRWGHAESGLVADDLQKGY